ncbi:MAG: type IV secretion system protein [Rickettsiales bacterium]
MKKILITGVLVLAVFFASQAQAQMVAAAQSGGTQYSPIGLYTECIYGYQLGDLDQDSFNIGPVGKQCTQICTNECGQYSRLSGVTAGFELNAPIISACTRACEQGQLYNPSSINIGSSGGSVTTANSPGPIQIACSTDPTNSSAAVYNAYETSLSVAVGDSLTFNNFSSNSVSGVGQGVIYTCGYNSVTIYPVFAGENNAAWSGNNSWHAMNSSSGSWSARNYLPTDTSIDVKDGDFLSISYVTDLISAPYTPIPSSPPYGTQDPRLIIYPANYSIWGNLSSYNNSQSYLPGDQLQFPTIEVNGSPFKNSQGTTVCNTDAVVTIQAAQAANASITWNGLNGTAATEYDPSNTCDVIGKKSVTFAGILNGFAPSNFTRLGITHYDLGPATNWADNLGGAIVSITRYGCPYYNGEFLQYAIAAPGAVPKASDWIDISTQQLQNVAQVTAQSAGVVFMRVNAPLTTPGNVLPTCNPLDPICASSVANVKNIYGIGNQGGAYTLQVTKLPAQGSNLFTPITTEIGVVRTYFYGSGTNPGVVQNLFNSLVADSNFMKIVRALLTLYIAFTGLSYVMGIAQITQKDGLKRIFFIGIVIALLSPNSWAFFNTYLFSFYIQGGVDLMAKMVNYTQFNVSSTQEAAILATPDMVFNVFAAPLTMIFSKVTWIKLLALCVSTYMGYFIAIAIFISGVTYAYTIFKAMLIYTMSLVIMGFLLLLAPIFISFALFDYTRKLFISWLEQLVTVALQPVFIVLAVGMFASLLLLGLEIVLGFTVCNACYIKLYVPPIINLCVLSLFQTLYSLHLPVGTDGAIVGPLFTYASVFYLLIISQAMYVFVPFMISLTNQLIGFGFNSGVDLGAFGNISSYAKPLTGLSDTAGFVTGRSKEVQQHSRAMKDSMFISQATEGKWEKNAQDKRKARNLKP